MSIRILKLLSLFFLSTQVFSGIAQKVFYVGIPASKMNYVASSQAKPQWCWAASIQMVLNYYGVSIRQEQIVERSYGRQANGELPNWAASIQTIHLNLNNWAVDNTGKKYFVNADFGLGAPEAVFLIEELSQKRPVIIAYQSNKGGHVVVITALSYIESDSGPLISSIIVRDPMTGEESKPNSGRVEYDAITLAKRITAYWFVKVMVSNF
jgi:hypothetical protein